MSNTGIRNQRAAGFRLGILGAGRLGDALAKVWLARTGEAPLVWSRGGQSRPEGAGERVAGGAWVADWAEALKAGSVLVALPGRALLDLAEGSEQALAFEGNVFSAAASLSRESLQRVFPKATVVCIAPFLIGDENSIPMLVLRPPTLPDSEWESVRSELGGLGPVDEVLDDNLFDHLSLLGAPWPVVVLQVVHAAAEIGVRGLEDEAAIRVGRSVFFKAMRSLLSTLPADGAGDESSHEAVATPGGITERGLRHVGEFTGVLETALGKMRARADEQRV